MRPHPNHSRRQRAFTLIELLVVIGIMALVVAFSRLAIEGLSSSGKFNASLSNVSGILEQGRAYAIAQDTYVWVVFYEYSPPAAARWKFMPAPLAQTTGQILITGLERKRCRFPV